MIEGIDKLKANFARVMRRLILRWFDRRDVREATSPPSDAENTPRHPLLGAFEGLLRVRPGTDLTKPADPDWGKK
jgi:hypothetical protein